VVGALIWLNLIFWVKSFFYLALWLIKDLEERNDYGGLEILLTVVVTIGAIAMW
jgi:hypothetical protein